MAQGGGGVAGLLSAEQTPTDSPSFPAALYRNQQQCPSFFLLLSILHKSLPLFSFKAYFLKLTQQKPKKRERKKNQLVNSERTPRIHSSPGTV